MAHVPVKPRGGNMQRGHGTSQMTVRPDEQQDDGVTLQSCVGLLVPLAVAVGTNGKGAESDDGMWHGQPTLKTY